MNPSVSIPLSSFFLIFPNEGHYWDVLPVLEISMKGTIDANS